MSSRPYPGRSCALRWIAMVFLYLVTFANGQERFWSVEGGQQLFTHEWLPHDSLSPAGDGLGPMHNAVSCVECHSQGGIGGAGPNEKNVELVSVVPTTPKKGIALRSKAIGIHPAFRTSPNFVLHKKSTFPDYDIFRLRMLGTKLSDRIDSVEKEKIRSQVAAQLSSQPRPKKFAVNSTPLQVSQRNTPALFGLDLIDSISSEEIIAEARNQAISPSGIRGRVAIANPKSSPALMRLIFGPINLPSFDLTSTSATRVGRFGWRGQIASLEEFVRGACANELGLQVSTNSQPINPLGPTNRLVGVDMTNEQCDALVSFVRSLPRPEQIKPSDPHEAERVDFGERSFRKIGCAECHKPTMGNVEGLYSDLLLHDMGRELGDLVPVNSESPPTSSIPFLGAYNGGGGTTETFTAVPARDRQSWRTPPLWGVRDSAPYLHDGRAESLRDAIIMHDGEAKSARNEFVALNSQQQSELIAFLQSLAAPKPSNEG